MVDDEGTKTGEAEDKDADAKSAQSAGSSEQRSEDKGGDVPPEVKRALAKANKEAETLRLKLKEFEDRDLSEQQKLEKRAAEAEARATDLEKDNLRYQVAADKGLTPKQARRLVGNTREELEADADELIEDIKGSGSNGRTSFDGGSRSTAAGGDDMNSTIRRLAGRG